MNESVSEDQPPSWLDFDEPGQKWIPHQLSGKFRFLPGGAARFAAEMRMAPEIAAYARSAATGFCGIREGLPPGDGQPVLLIPGFGFGDPSTLPLATVLTAAGYRPLRSRIWANIRCPNVAVRNLEAVAEDYVAAEGGPLLVVGHSRGGMLARGLAVRAPHLVKRAICLGAPLNYEFAFYEMPEPLVGTLRSVHQLHPVLRRKGCATPECSCSYMVNARKRLPADVDLVSIYTQSDGVVDWRACLVPGATNISVPGCHLGMGLNPKTLRVVLEQLAESRAAN